MAPTTSIPTTSTGEGSSVGDTAARLRLTVGRLARLLRRQDRSGLPLTLSAALATLGRRGPMTLGELAACEQLSPPTITSVITKLAERGLVLRHTDPDDRRVVRVELSARGRRQLATDRKRRVAWLAAQLEELDPADQARLQEALDVLERLTTTPSEGVDAAAPSGAMAP